MWNLGSVAPGESSPEADEVGTLWQSHRNPRIHANLIFLIRVLDVGIGGIPIRIELATSLPKPSRHVETRRDLLILSTCLHWI